IILFNMVYWFVLIFYIHIFEK
ncbi:hypothetical protein, partial [Plasmodium yoelii yoelii]